MKRNKIFKYWLSFFAIGFFGLMVFSFFPKAALADYVYHPLELIPGFESATTDFPTFALNLYKFGIWIVGICALLMLTVGGFTYLISAGNTSKMDSAKKIITNAILGLIIALGAYFLLFVINPDLVNVNISLKPFSGSGASSVATGGNTTGNATGTTGGTTTTPSGNCNYQTPSAGQNVCAGATCPYNCSNSTYDSLINTDAQQAGVDPKVVKALMCVESQFNPTAKGPTNDCGLMQVVTNGSSCQTDSRGDLTDPATNINIGTQLLKQKYTAVGSSGYSTVTTNQMVFASYNCCSNGVDNPNAASNDCGPTVPKWACPINPGTSQFNMCNVKSYACSVDACAKQL